MSTLTAPTLDLSKYVLATSAAHDLMPGDVIGASGDWCVIVSLPDQPPNIAWVEVEVAPIDDPTRTRPWQIFPDARMAVLRESCAS